MPCEDSVFSWEFWVLQMISRLVLIPKAVIELQLIRAFSQLNVLAVFACRCFGKEDRSVKYKSQTPESLVSNIFQDLRRCTSTQVHCLISFEPRTMFLNGC